jgi:hypothetical protein
MDATPGRARQQLIDPGCARSGRFPNCQERDQAVSKHRGDGVSDRKRKWRREMPPPEHTASLAELDAWLAAHGACARNGKPPIEIETGEAHDTE